MNNTDTKMSTPTLSKVSVNDLIALQKISKQTFYETFSAFNSEENMKDYLENSLSLEKLTTEFNNPNSEFYFANLNNEVIGYLKINIGDLQTEIQDKNTLEIERIYVVQEFHGKNIGKLLFDKAIEIAKEKKVSYVWLGVWEENPRAISFYKKNGFVEFDKHIFKLGDDEQTDLMMKLFL